MNLSNSLVDHAAGHIEVVRHAVDLVEVEVVTGGRAHIDQRGQPVDRHQQLGGERVRSRLRRWVTGEADAGGAGRPASNSRCAIACAITNRCADGDSSRE